ncbi:MAG: hypothetical protein EOM11_09315 [Erysipelotrichia bacterium]|jgi:predicted phosphodiesterase|nr:hypothetical protein [Erysipelotrichia bacterium]
MKPTAILTADWHLRDTQPICRTDNFWEAQWVKVYYILEMQKEYKCPVIHAGDLFHTWKTSPYLLSASISFFNQFSEFRNGPAFITVYGNHDLPQHNMELAERSGMHTLSTAHNITILQNGHWGETKPNDSISELLGGNEFENIAVWHKFVYTGNQPWPGCTDPTAEQILRKFPKYRLIVTGDNHTPFVVKYKNRLLVNPGAITRQTADQAEHEPRVYLWFAETNSVTIEYLPIKLDVITREHLEVKAERDIRMEAFISRLKEDWNVSLSFEDNLQEFLSTNKLRKSVVALIHKAMDGDVI